MPSEIPHIFNQTGDFSSVALSLDFWRNLMPILKETLHNIIKHSAATKVEISAVLANGFFELIVSDNGSGFAISNRQTGNGLKSIRRRNECPTGNSKHPRTREPNQT